MGIERTAVSAADILAVTAARRYKAGELVNVLASIQTGKEVLLPDEYVKAVSLEADFAARIGRKDILNSLFTSYRTLRLKDAVISGWKKAHQSMLKKN